MLAVPPRRQPLSEELGHLGKSLVHAALGMGGSCSESLPLRWDFPLLGYCIQRVSQWELELGEVLNPRRVGNLSPCRAGWVPRRRLPPLRRGQTQAAGGFGVPHSLTLGRSRNPEFGFPRLFGLCITAAGARPLPSLRS